MHGNHSRSWKNGLGLVWAPRCKPHHNRERHVGGRRLLQLQTGEHLFLNRSIDSWVARRADQLNPCDPAGRVRPDPDFDSKRSTAGMRVPLQGTYDPCLDLASVPAPAGAAAAAVAVPAAAPEERVTARSPHETKRITRPFALCIHAQGARRFIVCFRRFVALLLRPARVSLRHHHLFLLSHRLHGRLRLNLRGSRRRSWCRRQWRQEPDHPELLDFRGSAVVPQYLDPEESDPCESGKAHHEAERDLKPADESAPFAIVVPGIHFVRATLVSSRGPLQPRLIFGLNLHTAAPPLESSEGVRSSIEPKMESSPLLHLKVTTHCSQAASRKLFTIYQRLIGNLTLHLGEKADTREADRWFPTRSRLATDSC